MYGDNNAIGSAGQYNCVGCSLLEADAGSRKKQQQTKNKKNIQI